MAKSNALRQKLWRERQRTLDAGALRQKHASYMRGYRLRLSPKQARQEKAEKRDRMRRLRASRKLSQSATQTDACDSNAVASSRPAYRSSSTLGKAVKRVEKALPQSPNKSAAVVNRLLVKMNFPIIHASLPPSKKQQVSDIQEKVVDFYHRDDVSRQSPIARDVVICRNDEGKTKLPKRHMVMKLGEAYSIFVEEAGKKELCFSKFCSLRPVDVLLNSAMPLDVCLCKIHENFITLVDSLFPTLPYCAGWIRDNVVCKKAEVANLCLKGSCCECNKGQNVIHFATTSEEVSFWRWERVSSADRLHKVKVTLERDDALADFVGILPQFLRHQYVKRNQDKMYRMDKSSGKVGRLVVQVDFAENYTCFHQEEIQSAHWNQRQVTLFTACCWWNSRMESFTVASDSNIHDKTTAVSYLVNVLDRIFERNHPSEISEISVWSDGPSSQFKNRYVAFILPRLCTRYGCFFEWSYFSTSHGKGPVDGIGGTVKRIVAEAVKSRKCSVQCAAEFIQAAQASVSKVSLILGCIVDSLFEGIENAPNIPGIKDKHYIRASLAGIAEHLEITPEAVTARMTTTSTPQPVTENVTTTRATQAATANVTTSTLQATTANVATTGTPEERSTAFAANDYVIFTYERDLYPGVILSVQGSNVTIKSMKKVSPLLWQWPSKEDIWEDSDACIVQRINCPISTGTGSRSNSYRVPELECKP